MATFSVFKCKKCGYSVHTESQGHYALMSGEYYNFKCNKCKEIVSISSSSLAQEMYGVRCPKCGERDHLYTWNPLEGHCPKCNGRMEIDKFAGIIMAD
jgi:DNA-directed RNA polymerase subunit RPC12/RpoP